MMRTIALILAVFYCSTAFAAGGDVCIEAQGSGHETMLTLRGDGDEHAPAINLKRPSPTEHYTFYLDCDSLGAANKAAGDPTITYVGAEIDTDVKAVGTGSITFTSGNYKYFYFKELKNFDRYNCRVGFYVLWHAFPASNYLFTIGALAPSYDTNYSVLYGNSTPAYDLYQAFRGGLGNGLKPTAGYSADTWYYFECAFKNNCRRVYIDGVLKSTVTSSRANNAVYPQYGVFQAHASIPGTNIHFDNIIISTNPDEDLYAIRNNTSF